MKNRKTVGSNIVMVILSVVSCVIFARAEAAFDPDVLSQSTVRITIKQGDVIKSAATGFVWEERTQIVTSLHVLHHEDAVAIVEFNGVKRIATVAQVLPHADLVLLTVDDPVDGWVPLTEKIDDKPPYKAPITALGFNAGASGSMTRELHKGHANPEILKGLLPPDDRADLEAAKIPDIELDIYYLQGSLLPGFSGSPVVDAEGNLIGIGDGGLEDGASNVSWVIPARFLDDLTASTITELPGDLEKAGQLMSADIINVESYEDLAYEEIEFEGFVFVKTKTRSFEQLLESSSDPESLFAVLSLFGDYQIDYGSLEFDIYEDLENGLIITMPAGIEPAVSESGLLSGDFGQTSDLSYNIFYEVLSIGDLLYPSAESYEEVMHTKAEGYLIYLDEGPNGPHFVEYEGARQVQYLGDDRYILRTAFHNFEDKERYSREINYVSVATDLDIVIQVEAQLNRFDEDFMPKYENHLGTDCTAPGLTEEQAEVCYEVRMMMQMLASVHMVSFANAYVAVQ